MNLRALLLLRRTPLPCAVLFGSLAAGCGTESSPKGSVCLTCEPHSGGETSDFPSQTLCESLNRHEPMDAAQAAALPFVDLTALVASLEREIDVPLRWRERDAENTSVEGGYQAETRLHATSRVVSYTYVAPDPAFCDGTTCTHPDGDTVAQATCPLRLHVGLEIAARTLDGAIEANLVGEAGVWAPGFEDVIGPAAEEMHSHSYADLHAVVGTLDLTSDAPEPVVGELTLQITYDGDNTTGYLWPTLIFNKDQRVVRDVPLRGEW